jgi:hypothetical protein
MLLICDSADGSRPWTKDTWLSLFIKSRLVKAAFINILSRISVTVDRFGVRCRRRRPSGEWLVGPRRTSNRATSFFIRLGNN